MCVATKIFKEKNLLFKYLCQALFRLFLLVSFINMYSTANILKKTNIKDILLKM